MKPLTDDQRKRLTLYLGECAEDYCIHDPDYGDYCPNHEGCMGLKIRSFTTYADLGKMKDKLVENGEWESFYVFAHNKWRSETWWTPKSKLTGVFTDWIFRPESCGLVVEYLEQKEGK